MDTFIRSGKLKWLCKWRQTCFCFSTMWGIVDWTSTGQDRICIYNIWSCKITFIIFVESVSYNLEGVFKSSQFTIFHGSTDIFLTLRLLYLLFFFGFSKIMINTEPNPGPVIKLPFNILKSFFIFARINRLSQETLRLP